jgi:very-short-patch-repair endonuclease
VLSQEFHAALLDQAADERRFAFLDAEGFEVASVWDHEIWGDPAPAMARVTQGERNARARRNAA